MHMMCLQIWFIYGDTQFVSCNAIGNTEKQLSWFNTQLNEANFTTYFNQHNWSHLIMEFISAYRQVRNSQKVIKNLGTQNV